MKRILCILLMLIGCILRTEAGFYNPRRYFHKFKAQDEKTARELNDRLEKSIEEEWTRNTKADADPPTISNAASFEGSDIVGKTMVTFHNRTIYAFQGFRFGTAERFQPPERVDKFWIGRSFKAIHIGFKCPQDPMVGSDASGNEDCLFLNVYTPYLPSEGKGLLPVMQFIYGGGFVSGDSSYYVPTRLLDHDVILVTIHYRLGAFGFWTTNTEEAPGNMALYDMLESLRWTQRHIEDFGGDPDKVTVFGESAGSASASYMLVLPEANGLLRGVIADSGSCFDHWALDPNSTIATEYIAYKVGCDPKLEPKELVACMQTVSIQDLLDAESDITNADQHNGGMGYRGASPTLQTFTLSENATYNLILTKTPREYFQQRENNNNVAYMTGANKQEGSFVVGILYDDYIKHNNLEHNVTYLREQLIQDLIGSIGVSDDTHAIATSLQNYYCPDIDMANFNDSIPCMIDLTGAMFLKAGSWEVANYHSYYTDKPTYYYSFEFESDDSLWTFTDYTFDGGITHADDLLYLFSAPAIMDPGTQLRNMDRMTLMWTSFAIYLDPTPVNETEAMDALDLPIWTPYRFENHSVFVIAEDCTNEKEFSDRWTITVDELRVEQTTTTTPDPEACVGECVDYKDQRDTYEAVMITFIVLFVVGLLVAIYFIFKARR